MSKIEFDNIDANLIGGVFSPCGADGFLKAVACKSTSINATKNSSCVITADLVEIYYFDATVLGNSMLTIGGRDDTIIIDKGHAYFTISSEASTDISSIQIDGIDIITDKYDQESLRLNFDTSAPNFGVFKIPGNGNAFVVNYIFTNGIVCVNGKPAKYSDSIFNTDYTNQILTLSLKNGKY